MNQPNPYEAPTGFIEDNDPYVYDDPWDTAPLATRGSRLAASLIDGLITSGPFFAAGFMGALMDSSGELMGLFTIAAFGWLILIAAVNIYLLYQNGQTIGKKLMNIKIVRADRRTEAGLGRIIGLRVIPVMIVSVIPLVSLLNLVDILFIFSEDQQCLHDMVADTNVIQDTEQFATPADDVSW